MSIFECFSLRTRVRVSPEAYIFSQELSVGFQDVCSLCSYTQSLRTREKTVKLMLDFLKRLFK